MLEKLNKILAPELQELNAVLLRKLDSEVGLIKTICQFIIANKGKQLRPIVLFLCAKLLGYKGDSHINLAAVIELIHTATLLHDDVVDKSTLRRNLPTANSKWGNAATVLVGDYIYSRSFQMMVEPENIGIIKMLSHTTNTIAQGEILQLISSNNPDLTESEYLKIIRSKTGVLFSASAVIPAYLNNEPTDVIDNLSSLAMNLGLIFQITDDILDYNGATKEIGKNIGDDLKEGKNTLPLIIAIKRADKNGQALLKNAIKKSDISKVEQIQKIISQTDALTECKKVASDYAVAVLSVLENFPKCQAKDYLADLTSYLVSRTA